LLSFIHGLLAAEVRDQWWAAIQFY